MDWSPTRGENLLRHCRTIHRGDCVDCTVFACSHPPGWCRYRWRTRSHPSRPRCESAMGPQRARIPPRAPNPIGRPLQLRVRTEPMGCRAGRRRTQLRFRVKAATPMSTPTSKYLKPLGRSRQRRAASRTMGMMTRYTLSLITLPLGCIHRGPRAAIPTAIRPASGVSNRRPSRPITGMHAAEMKTRAIRWASADWKPTRSSDPKTIGNTGG